MTLCKSWCSMGVLLLLLCWLGGCETMFTAGNKVRLPETPRDESRQRYTPEETPTPFLFRLDGAFGPGE